MISRFGSKSIVALLLLATVFLTPINTNKAQLLSSTNTTLMPGTQVPGIQVPKSLIQIKASAVNPSVGTPTKGHVTGPGGHGAIKAPASMKPSSPAQPSYSYHTMAEDHSYTSSSCYFINPRTSFLTTDQKAEVDFLATTSSSAEVVFYYRDSGSRNWIEYYDTGQISASGTYCWYAFIYVSGNDAANLAPRAFAVAVYLDGALAFDEFFDVTYYNFSNSAFETATGVDSNGNPINPGKSTFTVGVDSTVYAYVGIKDAAYCQEFSNPTTPCMSSPDTTGHVHDLYAQWYMNGNYDHDHSVYWADYKNTNINYNYWGLIYDHLDSMSIDASKVGTWDVYFYLDYYYSGGSYYWYGPVAHIQFTIVQATQVTMTVSYSVIGGGSPTAPSFHYVLMGASKSLTLTKTATKVSVDSGSTWSVSPNPLGGSSSSQRWYSTQPLTGTASTTTIVFSFQHQYYLTMKVSGPGSVTPISGWQNAGVTVTIKATPNSGHKFKSWAGTGAGSYTGTSASHTITMNAAITETATFT